ncbi:hypothetical protein KPL47_14340 [Clostridium estertheticum]|uniref:type II secretion system protein n=1 Tax=Clostridium estertheticum TaxID=238834 RepID=UPI001C0E12D4|nr:hypothetical protein [Clostridium estertheticum]MBU3177514.1 hypothetical protein [Clostridium estertheticum]
MSIELKQIGSENVGFISKKTGFTLVEEIVSLAIIVIILITFLPAFMNGYKNIILSGTRTKNVSEAESKVGNAVQSKDYSSGVVNPPDKQIIKVKLFSADGNNSITTSPISGNIITFDNSGINKTTLSTFVPDDIQGQ